MGLTKQQQRAAHYLGSVAVMAGAGTGKTHMLAERYLHFLQEGKSPLNIVAVTFTEKAATELRARIRQTITQQMGNYPDLLAELEAAQISTFHALAARICREHPDKAHVPPDFRVQAEVDSRIWLAETFIEALTALPSHLYEQIPFSLMQEILGALLQDPRTAAEALKRDADGGLRLRADWLPLLEQTRQQALTELLHDELWQSSQETLATYTAPGDKLDAYRLEALKAIDFIEQGHNLAEALKSLKSLKINCGSQKNWGGKETLNEVKNGIRDLRTLAEEALKTGLITLDPNEYDDQTEAILPTLREAFTKTQDFLAQAKYQQRLLDFNDLEIRALQALEDPTVQDYYAQRWQVFLIDEFQDTNPTQGLLLEKLTSRATLTIVGDVKQSIYGFRRADVRVFQEWQTRIHPGGQQPVELSKSFRTHQALIAQINQVFAPVLGTLHQPLSAHRNEELKPTPNIQLYTVIVDDEFKEDQGITTNLEACRRVEAQKIADLVEEMLTTPIPVHDKRTGKLRPIQPGDIAILSRTWNPLEIYGRALAARGLPILQTGGGNLLDTREAKDAWAMLRFLADPSDSLALAAVLRSPFCAISDRALYTFVQSLPEKTSWWKQLRHYPDPPLTEAQSILRQLLVARRTETPTRLLQLSDRLTGYTAVIANLPDADRRLADWTGFLELVRSLEAGSFDVLAVIRRLKRIQAEEVTLPRPALAGGDAVNLMTIHGAKGLEWSVVIVPDLARKSKTQSPLVRFDADLGVALKHKDAEGQNHKSALYTLLEQRQNQAELEESKRILYVALTRARDRLLLTAAEPKGGLLNLLQSGLEGLIHPTLIPFDPELGQPIEPVAPDLPPFPPQILVQAAKTGLTELPVTALNDYALCPLRFKFRYLNGHPGYRDGNGNEEYIGGMEIGKLTHKALELKIQDAETLTKYANGLPQQHIQEALNLAQRFHQADSYATYRQGNLQWEHPITFKIDDLTLNGFVDLVGDDFVLDFKTDQAIYPQHYQFQLWAYRQATERPNAHIAYLRHDQLYSFDPTDMNQLDTHAKALVTRLTHGDFTPQPDRHHCGICPYSEICDSKAM